MADDPQKTGPQDAARVNVHEPYELEYWTKKFGVTTDQLRKAVEAVGPMVVDVEKQLKTK